ncbi:UNVERIFIED_CONTAM: putative mitochondrial protein [Sesamum latifolium]|uniref:Mitochondrial protein n=1 Tax=Sesamum latifolium TaxID=2727402 RepID=A0AAW2U406_9LAMI
MKLLDEKICPFKQGVITAASQRELGEAKDKLEVITNREEILYRQRAKALWLKKGDKNSTYFHAKAFERKQKKEITLQNELGIFETRKENIQKNYWHIVGDSVTAGVLDILNCGSLNRNLNLSYSFLLNGEKFGYVHPTRGLRQGDPLSPYLYLFYAEAFSAVIRRAEQEGSLRGVAISCTDPSVFHLLFADDTLILCQATRVELEQVNRLLGQFERASGLKMNLQKSVIVFNRNVQPNDREELAAVLGVQVVDKHIKYLGLPTSIGRSKKE